jgi:hypothetical protein
MQGSHSVQNRLLLIGGLGIASLLGVACTAEFGREESPSRRATVDSELLGDAARRWSNPRAIPVCFLNREGAESDAVLVRNLVTSEFQKAGICFAGWNRCSSATPCPAIRMHIGVPPGANGQYAGESFVGPSNWNCDDRSQWTVWVRQDQLDWASVHEFGHSIGIHHEHARTDSQGECGYSRAEQLPAGGTITYFGAYDRNSVMNYCSGQRRLSATDVSGLMAFYGTSGPAQCAGGGGTGGGGTGGGGSTCQDTHPNCGYWAGVGECSRNPAYMLTSCCASCAAGTCTDSNANCGYWASIGECSRNPGYMRTGCCSSCRGR